MAEDDLSDLLSDQHFEAFGRIVSAYASCETGIKLSLAGILNALPHEIMILSEPYSSLSLRNVSKSIAKLRLPKKHQEQFMHLIGEFGGHAQLRNHIAHNRWTRGTRPNSIRPVQMDIRSGKAKPKGYDPEERDFTLEEIGLRANQLFELNSKIVQFMIGTGLSEILENRLEAERLAIQPNNDGGDSSNSDV